MAMAGMVIVVWETKISRCTSWKQAGGYITHGDKLAEDITQGDKLAGHITHRDKLVVGIIHGDKLANVHQGG